MVIIGDEKYAIALGSIQTIEDVLPSDIKLVQNKEVIHIRGTVIPIIRLNRVLEIPPREDEGTKNMTVIIVKKGDKLAGLVVDELIGQQEVVIKSMGKYIKVPRMISGATILGNGDVALILDTNALI
jgi:two-component system chemotaxis sensor kinase CheA